MTSEPVPGPMSGSELASSDTALLETLILQAPVAFAFYGADLRYRRINRMLAEINGLPMEAHIGHRPAELLGDLGVAVEARLRQVMETGAVVTDDDFSAVSPVTGELRHYQSQWFPARTGRRGRPGRRGAGLRRHRPAAGRTRRCAAASSAPSSSSGPPRRWRRR